VPQLYSQKTSNQIKSRSKIMFIDRNRKAFNLDPYFGSCSFETHPAIVDLAAFAVESNTEVFLEQRIWEFGLILNDANNLYSVELQSEVCYGAETELDKQEAIAGLQMKDVLLNEPVGTVTLWISPPGGPANYQEGRLVLGVCCFVDGVKTVQSFGIPYAKSADDCFKLGCVLADYSYHQYELLNAESLRFQTFIIHPDFLENRDVFSFLKEKISDLIDTWDFIEAERFVETKMAALRDAQRVFEKISKLQFFDPIVFGALAEQEMYKFGWSMNQSACGLTNNELVDKYYQYSHTNLNQTPLVTKEQYVKKCPYCNKEYNKILKPGFKCDCGQVFLGVC